MAMLAVWLRGGWPSIEQRKLDVASVAERHAIVAMITKTTEDLTAEDPRRRSGFMRLPAYPCSERVRGCCQGMCVCACLAVLYNSLRTRSGMYFYHPRVEQTGLAAEK